MTGKPQAPERLSLSRWSRRKLEASSEPPAPPASAASSPPASAVPAVPAAAPGLPTELPTELPGVESLSFDSDFTAFLRPEVDEKLKRAALKQLFRDPRFNVMDGLDVYIDDYTKADPIPPDIVQDLLQRGFSAVTAAPNWPAEEPSASVSGASVPSVTGPAAESLPAPETTVASSTVAPAEPEPTPEPAPEQPDPSRSS